MFSLSINVLAILYGKMLFNMMNIYFSFNNLVYAKQCYHNARDI